MIDLGVNDSIPVIPGDHSFHVIPGTIPAELEFHSTFCRNGIINLADPCAKIDSSRIPGIAQILLDSSRNQWRTVKTLAHVRLSVKISPCCSCL